MDKKKIFLCHASEDKSKAIEIYHYLKKAGLKPWLDKIDLLPGQNWKLEIPKSLKACNYIFILFSNNSVSKRGYVQREFKLALDILEEIPDGQIFIIPIRLEECKIPERFSHLQYCDLFDPNGLKILLNSINMHLKNSDERSYSKIEINNINEKKNENFVKHKLKLIVTNIKFHWLIYIFILGISLFTFAFFLPVLDNTDFGYEAALFVLSSWGKWHFSFPLLDYIFINFSNFSIAIILTLILLKSYKKYFFLIVVLGLCSSFYWPAAENVNKLKIGYWTWLFGQLLIDLYFILKIFMFKTAANIAFAKYGRDTEAMNI